MLDSLLEESMSDTEDNGSVDDAAPGPSGQRGEARFNDQDDAFDYTSLQDLIELTHEGFNGSSSTGLAQDDMELTSKTKWLVIDPSYYPRDPEDRFFFKITDWSDQEHARFTYGLLSGTKNYVTSNSNQTSFASIINEPTNQEHKEFVMFSASIYAMSLVHMLAINLDASLGTNFPMRADEEVDEEEAEANYRSALSRHARVYDENARNIREMHDAWLADREQAAAKVKNALLRRKEAALADNPKEKLRQELIAAHKAKSFGSKNDVVKFIKAFILDHCATMFALADIPKKSFQAATLSIKRKRKEDTGEEDEEEDYARWAEMWVNLCLRELSDEESLSEAMRNISFLTQIDVHFNFSAESNLEEDLRRNEDERANSAPDRQRYCVVSETAYERALYEAYANRDPNNRTIIYEGSIKSAAIAPQDRITKDEVNKILPFLGNKNFGRIARYMVVLTKLHWFRTNHHVGTDKEGIAKSLADALDRALRAMPIEDKNISDNDVRTFFINHLHTISHWASTHLICGGLYMPSQKVFSGSRVRHN